MLKSTRNISGIFNSRKVDMDGVLLDQPLPQPGLDHIDPFLLIHHVDTALKGNQLQKDTGVGPHPHRGFSPVTLIFKGAIRHQDSRGNDHVVREGGAQWMNAGMGIIHSERPDVKLAEQGGPFEIIQFWVNTPAQNKMDQPDYFPVNRDEMPTIQSGDKLVELALISGTLNGREGPVKSKTPQIIATIDAKVGGSIELNVPSTFNSLLYLLDGKLKLNSSFNVSAKQLVWFKDNGDFINIECSEECRAILLAGIPINEDVVSSGPFVMNSHAEILEAMRDYQMGKMGILIENF